MKHLILFIAIILFSFNSVAQGYKGLKFGMTKKEVKQEFKINRADYVSVVMGGYMFRTYKQSYLYNEANELSYIHFTIKGAMTGVNEGLSRNIYKAVVKMFLSLGYLTDENTDFIISNTVTLRNKEKGNYIFIAIVPLSYTGYNYIINVGLMPYEVYVNSLNVEYNNPDF